MSSGYNAQTPLLFYLARLTLWSGWFEYKATSWRTFNMFQLSMFQNIKKNDRVTSSNIFLAKQLSLNVWSALNITL